MPALGLNPPEDLQVVYSLYIGIYRSVLICECPIQILDSG